MLQLQSECLALGCTKETEPGFSASLRIIDLGRLLAACCQIFTVCGKPDTTNNAKHGRCDVNTLSPLQRREKIVTLTSDVLGYEVN